MREPSETSGCTVETAPPGGEPTVAQAPELIHGRYQPVRDLGQGGMGSVALVLDRQHANHPVALKRVRADRLDKRVMAVLRNEFLAMASLEHPGLASVYDFGVDRETSDYFFTCEFVKGVHLLEACRSLDLSRQEHLAVFASLASQILRALEFIHSCGMVHGDIKPENILVTRTDAAGTTGNRPAASIKLIDFGLSRKEKEFGGKKILGTTFYIAPEAIGGSRMDRRTDLYSLGCVLYHVLTGTIPFAGETNIAVLKGHLEQNPAPPRSLKPSLPEKLDAVILRLMQKRPEDRFQTALEVLEAINEALGSREPLETEATRRSYLEAARHVNTEEPLAELCSVFAAACKVNPSEVNRELNLSFDKMLSAVLREAKRAPLPPGRMVLVRGERGLGKRKLFRQFKNLAQAYGATFVHVACSEPEAEGPAGDLASLLRDLAPLLPAEDERPGWLQTCFAMVDPSSPEAGGDEGAEALRELAHHLLVKSQEEPILLHFEDVHAASASTVAFVQTLADLQREKASPFNQTLTTATAGSHDDVEGTCFQRLLRSGTFRSAILDIWLSRLDGDGVAALLGSACPGTTFPEGFRERILEQSGGNPAAAKDVLHFLMEKDLLNRTARGWELAADFSEDSIPATTRRELEEKTRRLSPDARKIALAFAVLGNSTELDLAMQLASVSREAMLQGMKDLHRENLMETDLRRGTLSGYRFVHASTQGILYNGIPEETRRCLHDLAGRLFLKLHREPGDGRIARLANHFLKAGNAEEGVRYGVEAAEVLASGFEFRRAIDMYGEVLRVSMNRDTVLADQVRYAMACLHSRIGDYRKALEFLLHLAASKPVAGQQPHPTMVLIDIAVNSTRLGQFDLAARYLDKAAERESKQFLPVYRPHVRVARAELASARGEAAEALREGEKVLESRELLHDRTLLARLFRLLADSCACLQENERACSYAREALWVVDSARELEHLDTSFYLMGCLYRHEGKLAKAVRQFEICLSIRKKRGQVDGQGEAALELGSLQVQLDRPRRAAEALESALTFFEKTGNIVGTARACRYLAEAHALLGEYEDSRSSLSESLRLARKLGNTTLAAENYLVCSKVSLARGDRAGTEKYLGQADPSGGEAPGRRIPVMEVQCLHALQCGFLGDALQLASRGIDLARKHGAPLQELLFLQMRTDLELKVANRARARRSAEALLAKARRHGFKILTARAEVLMARIHATVDNEDAVGRSVNAAANVFREEDSERNLLELYLHYGLFLLKQGNLEHAFLYLEEAGYLAKKLNLSYWKSRIYLAKGLFEQRIAGNDPSKARDAFLHALKLATNAAYLDVVWQSQLHLGAMEQKAERHEEALKLFETATRTRDRMVRDLAKSYRDSFFEQPHVRELDRFREECRHHLGVMGQWQKKTAAQEPEAEAPAEASAPAGEG